MDYLAFIYVLAVMTAFLGLAQALVSGGTALRRKVRFWRVRRELFSK